MTDSCDTHACMLIRNKTEKRFVKPYRKKYTLTVNVVWLMHSAQQVWKIFADSDAFKNSALKSFAKSA